MMKQQFSLSGLLLLFAAVLTLAACNNGTAPKPVPATAAVPERVAKVKSKTVRPPRVAKVPAQNSQSGKVVVGTQEGGSRQGVALGLKYIVTTIAGKPGVTGSADGIGKRASFDAPRGITTDGISLYVADFNNHTIRKIDIASGLVTTLAGQAGKKGSNDGKGTAARFNRPYGITTDGSNIYVSDSNNHSIRQIDIETAEVTTLAGVSGVVGYNDGIGVQARFFIPEGITTDGSSLYVADTHNHSVRQIDLDTLEVTTIAGQSGASGYSDETASKARFSFPKGIVSDGNNLYVVDFGNHRIRKVSLINGMVTTLAGSEKAEAGVDEQTESARFNYPTGITTDGRNLYVADTYNRTVRKVSLSNGAITTIAGKAEVEGSANGSGVDARFHDPVGVTTDGIALYVTDSRNQTVRKIR